MGQLLLIPLVEVAVPPREFEIIDAFSQLPGRLVDLAVGPEAAEVLKLSELTVGGCSQLLCVPPQIDGMPPRTCGMTLTPFVDRGARGVSRTLFRGTPFKPSDPIRLTVTNPSDHVVTWDGLLVAECDVNQECCSKCGSPL